MDKSFIRAVACSLCETSEEWIGRHSSFTVCYESSIPHISSRIPFGLPLDAVTNLPSRHASRHVKRFNFNLYARTFLTCVKTSDSSPFFFRSVCFSPPFFWKNDASIGIALYPSRGIIFCIRRPTRIISGAIDYWLLTSTRIFSVEILTKVDEIIKNVQLWMSLDILHIHRFE